MDQVGVGVPSPPASRSDTVTFVRDGHDNVDLLVDQATPQVISRLFSVNVDTLWLKGSDGRSRFFPDRNNEYFDFTSDVGLFVTTLIVEGTAFSTRSSAGVSQPAIASRVQSISVQPLFSRRPSNTTGFVTVKILYSMMKKSATGNKLEFKKLHQMFVKVTESTANVHYITHMVRDKWSNHNLVLVSANGLLIEDCTGTQGLDFWRVGSRKIYAVQEKNLRSVEKGKHHAPADSPSSSEFEGEEPSTSKCLIKSDNIGKDIEEIKRSISSLFDVQKTMNIPVAVRHLFLQNFICHICHGIITPPAIFSRCCKYLIGCENCVDQWYSDRNKCCPRCRQERAFTETCRLNGLDDFFNSIKSMLHFTETTAAAAD